MYRWTASATLGLSLALVERVESQAAKWQLVEDLRIGSDASPMTMFTDIRSALEGADGRIFVLDARPQEIRVFDRAGKFVTLAARRGQGPGEISNANGMLVVKDAIWVNDPSNGRWSAYSAADGKYVRQLGISVTSYGALWEAATDAEGRVVDPIIVATGRINPATNRPIREQRLRRVRLDGSETDTVAAPSCDQRVRPAKTQFSGTMPNSPIGVFMGIPFQATPITVLDGRGGHWCSPNDEYLLVHRTLAKSDTLHTVRMPYTRLPVTEEQRTSAIARAAKSLSEYPVIDADYSLIPRVQPVFTRLDVDDKGQLWARRLVAEGSPLVFDVYDSGGRAVASITTSISFSPWSALHVKGDNVYGVVQDADDVEYVIRARILRNTSPAPI
jgi:hypothetical protein